MKILLIESDSAFAQELSGAIEARGIEARATGDGKEAIELARADRPDVIVLCVELPRMSGYSVCNKLKKDADLKAIPLVLVSAEATPETFEQHRKLKTRAEGYLIKPFGGAELLEVVGGLVELPPADADAREDGLVDLAEVQEVSLEPTEERSCAPGRGQKTPEEDEGRLLDEVFDQITADRPGEGAPATGAAHATRSRPAAATDWAADAPTSMDPALSQDFSRIEAEADEALAALSAQDLGGPGTELPEPDPADAPEAASAPLLAAKQQEILRLEARVTQLLAQVARTEGELSVRGGESSKVGEQVRQLEAELQRERERGRKLEESSRAAAESQARVAEAARKMEDALERARQEARSADERLNRLGAEAKGHSERAGGEEQARKAAESAAADAAQRVSRAEERAKAAAERAASLEERTRAAEARTHAAEERVHAAEERARQADDASEAAEGRARAAERLTAVAEERQREETARATAAEARAAEAQEEGAALGTRLAKEEETSGLLRAELESARSSAAELERTLQAAQAQASAQESELGSLRPELERLRVELAGVRAAADAERDATNRKLAEAADRITLLEAQLVRSEEQSTRTGQRLRVEKKAREKARKALAIALQLLDDGAPAASPDLAPTNGARREERS